MKAILLKAHGDASNMMFGDAEKPRAAAGQIVIKVAATSVNRPDIMQREGNYPPPPGESEILGLEVAGTVVEVGGYGNGDGYGGNGNSNNGDGNDGTGDDGNRNGNNATWKIGDRVMALIGGGGYAEYAVANADHAMRIPDAMDFAHAACVCETYITAYLNVFRIAGLHDAQTVLLHGGGGGVNTAAIQLCRNLTPHATIIVTASTGKVQRVTELGAHHVIDYRAENFAERVRELTDKRGADVILDHIGGAYFADNMKCLAVGGTLMLIGVLGGVRAEFNLAVAMVKRQRIIGSVLRSRPRKEKANIITDFNNTVMPLMANKKITPLISETYPLNQAAKAHQAMEASKHFGKIVLTVE